MHTERLEELQRQEKALEAAWVLAYAKEDLDRAAYIRAEYHITFQKLICLCRHLGIIGGKIDGSLQLSEMWKQT